MSSAKGHSPTLSSEQTNALFNILTHFETYHEIEALKNPATISRYGYPFKATGTESPASQDIKGRSASPSGSSKSLGSSRSFKSAKSQASSTNRPPQVAASYASVSESPVLQTLLKRMPLSLPGVREIPAEFWSVRLQGLIRKFAEADLSESYDKGAMGTRKTLATAFSAMMETLARGLLGGCPASKTGGRAPEYDLKAAADLEKAFDDCSHEMVYGNLLNEITDWLAKSEDVEAHSPMIQAVIEYEIIHLASLCHQVFVLSTEGRYLLRLIENVHGMVPYAVVRQTLRMSNAATMMSAMLKLFLSKLSLGSISNYIGITKNAEDGMNLLQRIISVVLGWDSGEFKKTVDRIEKDEKAPSKDVLAAIREHVRKSPQDRATAREKSMKEAKSIVAVVLETADFDLDMTLSEDQHRMCHEYLAALLSIRDRDEIVNVLCKSSPDLFTQAVRDVVAGFEPYIRTVHEKVDLREHITDFQSFVDQFIAVGKGRKVQTDGGTSEYSPPTVEDYAELLRGNKQKLYKWLHYGAKSAPDVTQIFRNWANEAVVHFRKPGVPVKGSSCHVEGTMVEKVANLFVELPEEKKAELIPVIDAHAAYLDAISQISRSRIQDILDGDSDTMAGPGIFLVMWQSLLDNTAITPETLGGPVRRGKDVRDAAVEGKTDLAANDTWNGGEEARQEALSGLPEAPDVAPVLEALGAAFRDTIATTEADDDQQSDLSID